MYSPVEILRRVLDEFKVVYAPDAANNEAALVELVTTGVEAKKITPGKASAFSVYALSALGYQVVDETGSPVYRGDASIKAVLGEGEREAILDLKADGTMYLTPGLCFGKLHDGRETVCQACGDQKTCAQLTELSTLGRSRRVEDFTKTQRKGHQTMAKKLIVAGETPVAGTKKLSLAKDAKAAPAAKEPGMHRANGERPNFKLDLVKTDALKAVVRHIQQNIKGAKIVSSPKEDYFGVETPTGARVVNLMNKNKGFGVHFLKVAELSELVKRIGVAASKAFPTIEPTLKKSWIEFNGFTESNPSLLKAIEGAYAWGVKNLETSRGPRAPKADAPAAPAKAKATVAAAPAKAKATVAAVNGAAAPAKKAKKVFG